MNSICTFVGNMRRSIKEFESLLDQKTIDKLTSLKDTESLAINYYNRKKKKTNFYYVIQIEHQKIYLEFEFKGFLKIPDHVYQHLIDTSLKYSRL